MFEKFDLWFESRTLETQLLIVLSPLLTVAFVLIIVAFTME